MKVTITETCGEKVLTTVAEGSFEEVQTILLDLGHINTTSKQVIEDTKRYSYDTSDFANCSKCELVGVSSGGCAPECLTAQIKEVVQKALRKLHTEYSLYQ